MGSETSGELRQDVVLGLGFLALAAGSMKRLMASAGQSGSETVITTFYSLILFTSLDRALWFFIPKSAYQETYAPSAQYAFKGGWVGPYVSEIVLFLGSLSLFSIFILMAIFWADLLKGIFKETMRPSRPMASFTTVAAGLAAAEGLNSCLFFARVYSSQGMLMFESVLLCLLSLVCSVEISRFSHRFRTVLRTLGAVNQISTEGQITRIVRITVTGNVFFAVRGACELFVGMSLYMYYKRYQSFDIVFNSSVWDWYIVMKHVSEWMILFLMMWILHEDDPDDASAAAVTAAGGGSSVGGAGINEGDDYWQVSSEDPRYGGSGDPTQQLTGNGRTLDEYGTV